MAPTSYSEVEILWAHSQRNLYFPINLFPEMILEVKQRRWLEVQALSGALTRPLSLLWKGFGLEGTTPILCATRICLAVHPAAVIAGDAPDPQTESGSHKQA